MFPVFPVNAVFIVGFLDLISTNLLLICPLSSYRNDKDLTSVSPIDKIDWEEAKQMEEERMYEEYMNGWKESNKQFREDITRMFNKFNI